MDMAVILLIVGLILFVGLVVVHEFGHFIAARRGGVEVEEFGIFFPPRLYKKQMKGGWVFTINLLPLGGFVKLKGEHDSDTEPGSFGAASLWIKTKIMAAGVVMNLLTALVLLTVLAAIGIPKLIPDQFTVKGDTKIVSSRTLVTYVDKGSPAEKAGITTSDEITDIEQAGYSPVPIASTDQLPEITKNFAGKTVKVFYIRNGFHRHGVTTLMSEQAVQASKKTATPKGYLGISTRQYEVQRSGFSAPVVAVGLSAQITKLTFQGLGHAVAGLGGIFAGFFTGNTPARQHAQTAAASQVSGPIGIYVVLKDGSTLGYQYMLFIIAIISLTLAIMNILPIPALDGGRLWTTLVARGILKRPLSPNREETINAVGFFTLIGLIIVISIVDVKRFF
jgi:regulator of sigma E protease